MRKIQSSTQFSSDELYYNYLIDMLRNSIENKRKDIGRTLIDIIKNENIVLGVINIQSNKKLSLVVNFLLYLKKIVVYIGDKNNIKWLINMFRTYPKLSHMYGSILIWQLLTTSYEYGNVDLLLEVLIEINYDLINLLLNMHPNRSGRRITFDIANVIIRYIDINELIEIYKKGLGSKMFRGWFGKVILSQV